jgi:5-oxoprolinase (ATP-hydrolysing) subunit A
MRFIDLSCDLGEASTDAERETEAAIWPMITTANVACGGHAGDAASMRHAAEKAQVLGVRLGAHPSYPDRKRFGRRTLFLPAAELRASLVDQIRALRDIADGCGVALRHVKPHGALYNDAHHDPALAGVIVEAMRVVDSMLALVASITSQMALAAKAAGTPVIREAFADRRYEPDGSLVSRGAPGALLSVDEAAAQARQLAERRTVTANDGSELEIAFDTICIHADMENSVERLRRIREVLKEL